MGLSTLAGSVAHWQPLLNSAQCRRLVKLRSAIMHGNACIKIARFPHRRPEIKTEGPRKSKTQYTNLSALAETNWPTSCPSPKYNFPADTKSIPFSAGGQSTWLKNVAAAGGTGLFYWEPAWVDNAALGSSCSSNTMFEYGGKALSSLATFKEL